MTTRMGAPANPFCTRYHAPGSLAFVFEPARGAASAAECYARFRSAGFRGEIAGPHGTGKTTLLRALEAQLKAYGHPTVAVMLQSDRRRMPVGWDRSPVEAGAFRPGPRTVLFLDGAEQLSRFDWWRVCWRVRSLGWGLLATTHHSQGLPVLYRTSVEPALAQNLVATILAQNPNLPRLVDPSEAVPVLERSAGDLRETIFRLYDLYEARWRDAQARPSAAAQTRTQG